MKGGGRRLNKRIRGGRKVLKRREGKKDEESEEVVLSREGRWK